MGTGLSGCTPRLYAHAVQGPGPRAQGSGCTRHVGHSVGGWLRKEKVIAPVQAKLAKTKPKKHLTRTIVKDLCARIRSRLLQWGLTSSSLNQNKVMLVLADERFPARRIGCGWQGEPPSQLGQPFELSSAKGGHSERIPQTVHSIGQEY
jgi:hypothetical protein